jgi:hypothetical protein
VICLCRMSSSPSRRPIPYDATLRSPRLCSAGLSPRSKASCPRAQVVSESCQDKLSGTNAPRPRQAPRPRPG